MRKLVASLVFLSLTSGSCGFAQDAGSAAKSNFPTSGYLPLPPHFQPRRTSAPDKVIVAPPPLPSYEQPAIPAKGYLWVPGFWAWRESVPDYFWVPGTWVQPPRPGLLWTPPYWSRVDGGYAFHAGYWAEQVGFYGGIDYGYGYAGDGYQGGRWEHDAFSYNRAANNLGSLDIASAYDQAVTSDSDAPRVSFNGGSKGTKARPMPHHEAQADTHHAGPTEEQRQHFEMAARDRSLYSKLNNGEPGVAATRHAGVLDGAGVTRSSRAPDHTAQSGGNLTTDVNAK